MGWKSTKHIKRVEAIELLQKRILNVLNISDEDLGNMMDMHYGDDPELEYFGYNFIIDDNPSDDEERAEYERLKEKFGD